MVCRMNTHPLPGCYEHVFDSPIGLFVRISYSTPALHCTLYGQVVQKLVNDESSRSYHGVAAHA